MLCLFEQLPAFDDLKAELANLKSLAENISRQLRAWADALQNSDIKGQPYLNDQTRRTAQATRDREEFREELRRVQEANIKSAQQQQPARRSGGLSTGSVWMKRSVAERMKAFA